jgi:hypothetical protein
MKLDRLFFVGALLLGACHTALPEGVYPCTMASDCPAMWVCRADLHCWSHEVPVDGGVDGGIVTNDAVAIDTAHVCIAETCNGLDDDCDGLTDEALLAVGPAITATSTGTYLGALLAPLPNGFEVFATPRDSGSFGSWITIDAMGAPTSSLTTSDIEHGFLDTSAMGSVVVVSGGAAVSNVLAIDSAMPSAPRSSYDFDMSSVSALVRLASFDGTIATAYAMYTDGSSAALWRTRVDLSGVGTLSSDMMVASDPLSAAVGVLHVSDAEYVAYETNDHQLVLCAFRMSAFHVLGTIASTANALTAIELSARHVDRPVDQTNPIIVAWSDQTHVSFAEVTRTDVLEAGSVRPIPTALGTGISFVPLHHMAVAPAAAPMVGAPAHWIVAAVGDAHPTDVMLRAQVFEITASSVRELMVPGETPTGRAQVSLSRSGSALRMAEAGNADELVTRAIGCE